MINIKVKCSGKGCPQELRGKCFRQEDNPHHVYVMRMREFYMSPPYDKEKNECAEFIDIKEVIG